MSPLLQWEGIASSNLKTRTALAAKGKLLRFEQSFACVQAEPELGCHSARTGQFTQRTRLSEHSRVPGGLSATRNST
jgi:hypothetical protein